MEPSEKVGQLGATESASASMLPGSNASECEPDGYEITERDSWDRDSEWGVPYLYHACDISDEDSEPHEDRRVRPFVFIENLANSGLAQGVSPEWRYAALQARNDLRAIEAELLGPDARYAVWTSPAVTLRWIDAMERNEPALDRGVSDPKQGLAVTTSTTNEVLTSDELVVATDASGVEKQAGSNASAGEMPTAQQQLDALIASIKNATEIVERNVAKALHAATRAIYFADSSDYGTALWEVVTALDPRIAQMLEDDEGAAAYAETKAGVAARTPTEECRS